MRKYRYTTNFRPRNYWEYIEEAGEAKSITVHERRCESQRTGLLDKRGRPLYRIEEPMQVGFLAGRLRR